MNGDDDEGVEEDLRAHLEHRPEKRAYPDNDEKEVQPQIAELLRPAQPANAGQLGEHEGNRGEPEDLGHETDLLGQPACRDQ